jgi:hypothetical protein
MEKTVITQEIKRLRDMLGQTIVQMDKMLGLCTGSENLEGIEKAEFAEIMRLCEVDDVKCLHRKVAYLLKPRWEGRLQKQANGRFAFASGNRVLELTCGYKIELFVPDEGHEDYGWQFGRVEHSDKYGGYYFFNESGWDHHCLHDGMTAAIRK